MKKLNKAAARSIVGGVIQEGGCRSYDGGKTWKCAGGYSDTDE